MSNLPNTPSNSTRARNPHIWSVKSFQARAGGQGWEEVPPQATGAFIGQKDASHSHSKSLLNKTETRYRDSLLAQGITGIMEQAITLKLDWPYKSYRPDLAYVNSRGELVLVEVKARHRFMEKGIAKAALCAKCYPMFRFDLALWENQSWKVSVLTP